MPMTPDQRRSVEAHLQQWLAQTQCSVCAGQRWDIEEELLHAGVFDGAELRARDGATYPAVAVTCAQCHQIVLFSAVRLGLL